MTQHKEMIEEARRLLNNEKQNIPSLSWNIGDDFMLVKYKDSPTIKRFDDKRKKDVVLDD
jgi:hypothetical protein